MNHSSLLSLSKIGWQFFCSLTLKKELRNDDWAVKKFFALGREVSSWNHIHFKSLVWCLRSEDGEATGRRHYHALLAGLPEHTIHRGTCFAIKKFWEYLGGGFARVYVFNPTLDGVGYILKGLDNLDEAQAKHTGVHSLSQSIYEMGKFLPNRLMLSKSFQGIVMKRMNIGDRQRIYPGPAMPGGRQCGRLQTARDSKAESEGLDSEAEVPSRLSPVVPLLSLP